VQAQLRDPRADRHETVSVSIESIQEILYLLTIVIKMTTMKSIPAGEFKTHCLRIMDEVSRRRQSVVITKKGVPVAKLVPVERTERKIVGCLEGVMAIVGDIENPLVQPEVWEVD